jgi:hypothetical protein
MKLRKLDPHVKPNRRLCARCGRRMQTDHGSPLPCATCHPAPVVKSCFTDSEHYSRHSTETVEMTCRVLTRYWTPILDCWMWGCSLPVREGIE